MDEEYGNHETFLNVDLEDNEDEESFEDDFDDDDWEDDFLD